MIISLITMVVSFDKHLAVLEHLLLGTEVLTSFAALPQYGIARTGVSNPPTKCLMPEAQRCSLYL